MMADNGNAVLLEAERLRRPEPELRTWPPLEPVMPYFQIKGFPIRLRDRLKILAIVMQRRVPEVASRVIEAGLDALEAEAKIKRSE